MELEETKFSDLDIDIPSNLSEKIKKGLIKASIHKNGRFQPHPAGVYFYRNIPSYNEYSLLDYKEMEQHGIQKIDFLNNSVLDEISPDQFPKLLDKIDKEEIDWKELYKDNDVYQLSNYPGILREFKVQSVLDIAIVLAIIRPGARHNYDKLKKIIHTDNLLKLKSGEEYDILKDTYGIPVFKEQFDALGIDKGLFTYKKPHSIGYAYVLLLKHLTKIQKNVK